MRISPSQIRLFRSCQRAWWYDRHTPRGERVQTSAQALGDEVQDHLDAFLQHGTIPPLGVKAGRIALSGLRHLPAPGPWNQIEYEFAVPLVEGVDLVGRMDCYVQTRDVIVDHKTTWSIDRYAMTQDEFVNDPQRIAYAYAHFKINTLALVCVTRWVYYQTKEPFRSEVREHEDTRESAEAAVESLRLTAEDMVRLHDDRDGCARDFLFCTAYGGCPHISQCYADHPEGHDMSIVEELRAKAAKRKGTLPIVDTTAVEKPAEPSPEPETRETVAMLEGVKQPPKKRGRPAKKTELDTKAEADPAELASKAAVLDLIAALRYAAEKLEQGL